MRGKGWLRARRVGGGGWGRGGVGRNGGGRPKAQVGSLFFGKVVEQARGVGLMSDDHFTVDGTLIDAWASLKSFRPKEEKPEDRPPPDDKGNPTVNFHGEKRSHQTHESKTDTDARLAKK